MGNGEGGVISYRLELKYIAPCVLNASRHSASARSGTQRSNTIRCSTLSNSVSCHHHEDSRSTMCMAPGAPWLLEPKLK